MRLAIDTDSLVKMTKVSLKEVVSREFEVVVAPSVKAESVDQGKAHGHADALRIEENLRRGKLRVVTARRSRATEATVRVFGLTGGEADTLRLHFTQGTDLVVSDDARYLRALEDLDVPFATTASVLAALVGAGRIPRRDGLRYLDALAGMISEEEYLAARESMEE